MFCDKTGTLTENKMIFKRCTIGGSDFAHKSFSRVSNLGTQSQDSSCVKDNQSGRAIIPVNPILSERLNSIDRQILIDGTDTKITKEKQVLKIAYKALHIFLKMFFVLSLLRRYFLLIHRLISIG